MAEHPNQRLIRRARGAFNKGNPTAVSELLPS